MNSKLINMLFRRQPADPLVIASRQQTQPERVVATQSSAALTQARLSSLDVFRGVTIAAMVLVNNPGDWDAVYPLLWSRDPHHWTLTQLIAPFFLWIIGVAITIAFSRRLERGEQKSRLFWRVLRRAALLFALGILIASVPDAVPMANADALATLRIPGILQRIAISYLAASAIVLWSSVRMQTVWLVGSLVVFWLLIMLVPAPGYGAGYHETDGNIAFYIDHLLLGAHAKPFDPLGILGTLPAISTTLGGVLAGRWIQSRNTPGHKTAGMLIAGTGLVGSGLLLGRWMPINTSLYTSSAAVFMIGAALLVFAACYWIVDVRGYVGWTRPFVIFGLNAITMFVLSQILASLVIAKDVTASDGARISVKALIYRTLFVPLGNPINVSLYYALAWVLGFYLLAYVMYRKRWFLTV